MTEVERAEVEAFLAKHLAQARSEVAQADAEARPVDLDLSVGRLSRMDLLQAQQMALARKERLAQRITQLEAAQRRLERGEYGECLTCGEPIAIERLRARPEVTRCLACQRGEG